MNIYKGKSYFHGDAWPSSQCSLPMAQLQGSLQHLNCALKPHCISSAASLSCSPSTTSSHQIPDLGASCTKKQHPPFCTQLSGASSKETQWSLTSFRAVSGRASSGEAKHRHKLAEPPAESSAATLPVSLLVGLAGVTSLSMSARRLGPGTAHWCSWLDISSSPGSREQCQCHKQSPGVSWSPGVPSSHISALRWRELQQGWEQPLRLGARALPSGHAAGEREPG